MARKLLIRIIISLTALTAVTVMFVYQASMALGQNSSVSEILSSEPTSVPSISFTDKDGKKRNLEEFKGKVTLVNFWALWCFPCKEEMPALAKLKKKYAAQGLEVLPLSSGDFSGIEGAKKFYKQQKIKNLDIYLDTKSSAFRAFGLRGLPTTIVLDRNGMEVGRVMGFIEWNSDETHEYIENLLQQSAD